MPVESAIERIFVPPAETGRGMSGCPMPRPLLASFGSVRSITTNMIKTLSRSPPAVPRVWVNIRMTGSDKSRAIVGVCRTRTRTLECELTEPPQHGNHHCIDSGEGRFLPQSDETSSLDVQHPVRADRPVCATGTQLSAPCGCGFRR